MIKTYTLSEDDIKQAIAYWMNKETASSPRPTFTTTMITITIKNESDRPGLDKSVITARVNEPVTKGE